jgi:hypothetical protein
MPVTYQIDKASGIIHTQCTGRVTLEEVIGHFQELERDPECPDHLDVFLDLTHQATLPRPDELKEVSFELARVRPRVQFGSCAIVANRDALFGMLRMFEVLAEQAFRETRVFRDRSEAQAWLASHRSTSGAAG